MGFSSWECADRAWSYVRIQYLEWTFLREEEEGVPGWPERILVVSVWSGEGRVACFLS